MTGRVSLITLIIISFLSHLLFSGIYWLCGITFYEYPTDEMELAAVLWKICMPLIFLLVLLLVFLLVRKKGKPLVKTVCRILLVAFIITSSCGAFGYAMYTTALGVNGCSYTEDIQYYKQYEAYTYDDKFPEAITNDMTVVDFSYWYVYSDKDHTDLYLEVKFDNEEIMSKYVNKAIDSYSEEDINIYPNPYDPKYTDINEKDYGYISFNQYDNDKNVSMEYFVVSYSYEDLTIIYSSTHIGEEIITAQYYPKFLKRFDVEFDHKNAFDVP